MFLLKITDRKIFLQPKSCVRVRVRARACACVSVRTRVSRSTLTSQVCLITLQINSQAPNYGDDYQWGGHSRGHRRSTSSSSSTPRPSQPQGHLWPRFGRMGGGSSRRCQRQLQTHTHTQTSGGGGASLSLMCFYDETSGPIRGGERKHLGTWLLMEHICFLMF